MAAPKREAPASVGADLEGTYRQKALRTVEAHIFGKVRVEKVLVLFMSPKFLGGVGGTTRSVCGRSTELAKVYNTKTS